MKERAGRTPATLMAPRLEENRAESKSLHHDDEESQENPTGLSVIIPSFNEESRLGLTLDRILRYLDRGALSFEVIVVDDGSSDGTAAIAEALADERILCLRQPQNLGKGAALRRGVLASRGRMVLLTDADLSTPIEELTRLQPHLDSHEVVIGSRAVADSQLEHRQPIYRELMGKTFNKIIRLAGVHGLNDTQCGFKLLDGAAARRVFEHLVTPGFGYDVELIWLARRLGYRVREVGVRWAHSPPSRVRPIHDSLMMLIELVLFRWHHRRLPAARHAHPSSPSAS